MQKQYIAQFNFDASNAEDVKNIVSRALTSYEKDEIVDKIKRDYSVIEVPFSERQVFVNMAFVKLAIIAEFVEEKQEVSEPKQESSPVTEVA